MDIARHEKGILTLESQLDKLLGLANKIEAANGMSKSFALEALEVLPTFADNLPAAFYTAEPSIAQHHAALEEISAGIWALIIAAGVALIAMVAKFVGWLFGSKDNSSIPTSVYMLAIESRLTKSEQLWEKLEQFRINHPEEFLSTTAAAAIEDMSGGKMPRTLDEVLDEYIKTDGKDSDLARALKTEDPLFHDVIYGGDYSKAIKSTSHAIALLPVSVTTSTNLYLKLVQEVTNHIKSLGNAKEDSQPVSINLKPIELDMFGNGKRISIGDGVTRISEIRQNIIETHQATGAHISFAKLSTSFSKALQNVDIAGILKKIESTKNHMDKLLSDLAAANAGTEKMHTHVVSDQVSLKYGEKLRDAFRIARVDVINCFRFFHEIMQYATVLRNMDNKLVAVQKAAIRVIESEIKKNHGSIPAEFKELSKKFSNELDLDFTN